MGQKNNREILTDIIGSNEDLKDLEIQSPNKFKLALEKAHLVESTHDQLISLKDDITKSPEEKLDAILNVIHQRTESTQVSTETLSPVKRLKEKKQTLTDNFKSQLTAKWDPKSLVLLEWINQIEKLENTLNDPEVSVFKKLWARIQKWFFGFILKWKWWDVYKKFLSARENMTLENIVTPEKATLVKNTITQFVSKKLNVSSEQINAVLDNSAVFSDEKILNYYDHIKSWRGLNYTDLIIDFKGLDTHHTLLTEKEQLEKKWLNALRSQIETQYDKTLTDDETVALNEIYKKYFWESLTTQMQKIINNKWFQFKDFFPIAWRGALFMLDLVWSWIIGVWDMIWNVSSRSSDIIDVSFWLLPFTDNIAIDDLVQKIGEMDPAQRGLFIWLLYRKWGLLLDIIWSVASASTRLLLDATLPANTWIDGIKLFTDSFKSAEKQIDNLAKIEAAIENTGVHKSQKIEDFKQRMKTNLRSIKHNAQIIEILKKSNSNLGKFDELIAKKEYKHLMGIFSHWVDRKNIGSFDGLRDAISTKMKHSFHDTIWDFTWERVLKEQFVWFGKNTQMQKFDRVLSDISTNQARIVKNKLDLGMFKKLTDSFEMSKISNVSDRLLFELRSKKDAKAFIKQMNTLAQTSPDLIKWFFSKLPIISVVGLAATDKDEEFWKTLLKESVYLIPLIGPIWIIWNGWVTWEKWYPEIIDPMQTGIAGWLLALDGFFTYKAARNGTFLKFIWKPLTDIVDIWKGSVKWWRAIYKTGQAWSAKKFGDVIRKVFSGKKKIIATILWWLILSNGVFAGEWIDDYKDKNGDIDTEKLKSEFHEMSNTEKEQFLKLCFDENVQENMTFELTWNTLSITSNTPTVSWDWFINDSIRANIFHTLGINIGFATRW